MPNVPAGAKKPSDRLKAEAASDGEIVADFKGTPIRALPFLDWDNKATAHLNTLNFAAWAEGALHPDDVQKFVNVKATNGETLRWITKVAEDGGGDLGELGAS